MTQPRPNILLVTADQLRADCLSAAGRRTVRTPVLDQLAAEGAMFMNHFGQCPPCGPSRTSLLTGMYQMNHRAVRNGTPLDAGVTNIAEAARTVGYTPWLIGYTDTAADPRRWHASDPRANGLEEILPGMLQYAPGSEHASRDSDWLLHLRQLGYPGWDTPYRQQSGYEGEAADRGPTYAPTEVRAEHSDTAYSADRAIRFFNQNAAHPWFLHLSLLRPHPPLVAPEPWHDMYDLADVPEFVALPSLEAERSIHPFMPFRLERLEMNPPLPLDGRHPNENRAWRQARATYYGLVSEIDHHLGRMLEALKALNQYESTLIIFTSDHGEMLGDHWCWGKETTFDQAVHVPLIIRSPFASSAARARVVDAFSEHVDIMPTVLDYIDAEVPLQCDGRSLRALIEGDPPGTWRDEVHWEYDFRSVTDNSIDHRFGCSIDELNLAVVRTGTEKYVHFAALPPLYYDIGSDPGELSNLAGTQGNAPAMLNMAQRMLSWRASFNRRELTGIQMGYSGRVDAARERRIV